MSGTPRALRAPRFSIVIPYKQRLDNVRLALASLAEQTLGPEEFEVIVGAMEYAPEFTEACAAFAGRLQLVTVHSAADWQVALARNLALRQATGEIVICLDADMILPPDCLSTLYERYYAYGQRVCVAGQMIDYDNNAEDVTAVTVHPYSHYRATLAALSEGGGPRSDPRLAAEHVIPWAYAWTAFVAVPRALIEEHRLTFDPAFTGYGVEDLEWAYRIARTGTPIVMAPEVWGVHLPHLRNVAANRETERRNYRYFVGKWPEYDVELAAAFGDFEANGLAREYRAALREAAGGPTLSMAAVRGPVKGEETLFLGVLSDGGGVPPEVDALLDPGAPRDVLPLAGLALPYEDGAFAECRVLGPVGRLPKRYRDAVLAEAGRVARSVRRD